MNANTIAHILTIKTTWTYCESSGCMPEGISCPGHRDTDWSVCCPYEGLYNAPGRDCTVWTECECLLSEEERDGLYCDEEGPCPTSPVGTHHYIGNADIFPGIPILGCWPHFCPCTSDHIELFQERYGDGTWFVTIAPPEDCDEGMEFEPLAKVED